MSGTSTRRSCADEERPGSAPPTWPPSRPERPARRRIWPAAVWCGPTTSSRWGGPGRRRPRRSGPCPQGRGAMGPWLLAAGMAGQRAAAVPGLVADYRRAHPLEPGPPAEVARRELDLPDAELLPAVVRAPLVLREGRVVDGSAGLPPAVQSAVDAIRARLAADPLAAP